MAYSSDLTSLTIFSLGQITLMDWGNAIVRSKITDSSSNITSITMELHLDGDFRKTKKKVTWLSHSPAASLVEVTLVDYDYLITKKKLEEGDDVKDFVTPVSEFREEAVADGNVKDLKQGDIIQFERKGYYIFDGVSRDRLAFIKIPDGKAAGLASKTGKPAEPTIPKQSETVSTTKMYKVQMLFQDEIIPAETKMYTVKNVYDV